MHSDWSTDWSLEIFELNAYTNTTFSKVVYECIDREAQYTHKLPFETQYTTVDQQKKL